MISSLLKQTEEVAIAFTQYSQDKNQVIRLAETLGELQTMHKAITGFANSYNLLAPRINNGLPEDFSIRLERVKQSIATSHERFADTPWQVNSLRNIQSELDKLKQFLLSAWGSYVRNQVKPVEELAELLSDLPELRGTETPLVQSIDWLKKQADTLPNNVAMLQAFDQRLESATQILTGVDGITVTIRDFLRNVHRGTFTVLDLNDEILTWCRVNDRGRVFKVRA